MKFIGSCRYCGQVINSNRSFSSQEDADNYASDYCDCPEASLERKRREQIDLGKEKIKRLFGEDVTALGFDALSNDTIEFLNLIVEKIVKEKIAAATVKLENGEKVVIAETAKGGLKIQRNKLQQCQLTD